MRICCQGNFIQAKILRIFKGKILQLNFPLDENFLWPIIPQPNILLNDFPLSKNNIERKLAHFGQWTREVSLESQNFLRFTNLNSCLFQTNKPPKRVKWIIINLIHPLTTLINMKHVLHWLNHLYVIRLEFHKVLQLFYFLNWYTWNFLMLKCHKLFF